MNHPVCLTITIGILLVTGCAQERTEVTSAEHKFKIVFPQPAKVEIWKTKDRRDATSWRFKDGSIATGGEFEVSVAKAPAGGEKASKEQLDASCAAILQGFKAKATETSDFRRDGVIIGRRMKVAIADLKLEGTIVYILANNKAYELSVLGQPDWKGQSKTDAFLNSFELIP